MSKTNHLCAVKMKESESKGSPKINMTENCKSTEWLLNTKIPIVQKSFLKFWQRRRCQKIVLLTSFVLEFVSQIHPGETELLIRDFSLSCELVCVREQTNTPMTHRNE